MAPQSPKKYNSSYNVYRYIVGIFWFIGGSIWVVTGQPLGWGASFGGLLFALAGVALIPPISEKLKKHPFWKNATWRRISTVVVFGLVGVDKNDYVEVPKEKEAPVGMSAKRLFADYQANEIAADNKYNGEELIVRGVISDIGQDPIDDKIYITLGTGHVIGGIQCAIDKETAARLSKGQRVRVIGECTGLLMSVHLEDCELVE